MALETEVRFLTTGVEKGLGAMFRQNLGGCVLAFVYPRPAPRLFHTFFSPQMRILALSDEGEALFDEIVLPWRWVRLPVTRLIVECDPGQQVDDTDLASIAAWSALAGREDS